MSRSHKHTGPRQGGTAFLVPAAFLLVGAASLFATTSEHESTPQGSIRVDTSDLEPMAKISPEEAMEKALIALRSASVEEVELEIQDGYLVYDVEVHLGAENLEMELVIDAGDGSVLAAADEDEDEEDEREEEDDER
jgi:uncharacterized membrane protein YkoI